MNALSEKLLGIGIYTPMDAKRLTGVSSEKVRRWLRGHSAHGKDYAPLWHSQVDIGDGETYLGFRDLTEIRVVNQLVKAGLSPQKVRRAIQIARDEYGLDRPLSTNRFRTDGKQVFLLLSDEGDDRIVDVFRNQYEIKRVVEPSFKGLEFNEAGEPMLWRIARGVLIDPNHSFGQPVEQETFVPTSVLAAAAEAEGSPMAAAKAFGVPLRAVNHALAFEKVASQKLAA